jgi:hypothetical protein
MQNAKKNQYIAHNIPNLLMKPTKINVFIEYKLHIHVVHCHK